MATISEPESAPFPNLAPLFDHPVLEQMELTVDYPNRGSLVAKVRTCNEEVVARTFRLRRPEGPFWGTLNDLFGVNPVHAGELLPIYSLLATSSPLRVPRVRRTADMDDRTWLIVDYLDDGPLASFQELSDAGLLTFGMRLAQIHKRGFTSLGTVSGTVRFDGSEFPRRLAYVMGSATTRAPGAPMELGREMRRRAEMLSPPKAGALVMPDMLPSQFLVRNHRISAVVDLDAYMVGPRELDFSCLELFLDDRSAELIHRGYGQVLPPPLMRPVRRLYRYFMWLLTVGPNSDLDAHMRQPHLFP
ncbi:phosphotransferase [Streptomyces sp900129855]|uniref:Phosphotransferase n=1 Tax=Streptomyces sp. 900129855 TaxID=3155129 RepID=A0ABV2ZZ24_9ACTN